MMSASRGYSPLKFLDFWPHKNMWLVKYAHSVRPCWLEVEDMNFAGSSDNPNAKTFEQLKEEFNVAYQEAKAFDEKCGFTYEQKKIFLMTHYDFDGYTFDEYSLLEKLIYTPQLKRDITQFYKKEEDLKQLKQALLDLHEQYQELQEKHRKLKSLYAYAVDQIV